MNKQKKRLFTSGLPAFPEREPFPDNEPLPDNDPVPPTHLVPGPEEPETVPEQPNPDTGLPVIKKT